MPTFLQPSWMQHAQRQRATASSRQEVGSPLVTCNSSARNTAPRNCTSSLQSTRARQGQPPLLQPIWESGAWGWRPCPAAAEGTSAGAPPPCRQGRLLPGGVKCVNGPTAPAWALARAPGPLSPALQACQYQDPRALGAARGGMCEWTGRGPSPPVCRPGSGSWLLSAAGPACSEGWAEAAVSMSEK